MKHMFAFSTECKIFYYPRLNVPLKDIANSKVLRNHPSTGETLATSKVSYHF
jgi:hypothetical protein